MGVIIKNRKFQAARKRKRWTQAKISEITGLSIITVNRWENGLQAPHPSTLDLLCDAFGMTPYELGFAPEEVDTEALQIPLPPRREDWGEAPHIEQFYGREQECAELRQWIFKDKCRVVAILGMGGIGKTSLAVEIVDQVASTFDFVFWRSLHNAPPLANILQDCINFIAVQQKINLPENIESQISFLIELLRERHCLLVFDNIETILQDGAEAGLYREGYENYAAFIRRLGETRHQSCLLLTSREKTREVALLEGNPSSVRSLNLSGLTLTDGREIIRSKGLQGNEQAWEVLVNFYEGNPLSLKLVSQFIQEVFDGNIENFLSDGEVVFQDVRAILDQQFNRLSMLEQTIMYWLAIDREPVSIHDIQDDCTNIVTKLEMQEALRSLRRRFFVEVHSSSITLQNVIMGYVTDRFVTLVCQEMETQTFRLSAAHSFIKAQSKDFIRESQIRLILKPIVQRLINRLGEENVVARCKELLSLLRKAFPPPHNYVAGNILNMLILLGSDLSNYDFSHLFVLQAYLPGVELIGVNFTHTDLSRCVFTDTFGGILTVAFNPDSDLIAAGTANGEIRLWQNANGLPLRTLQGHTDWVRSIAFSQDGKLLVSGSDDKTVRIWDVATGQLLTTLIGHTHWIMAIAFSKDGKTIASGGEEQIISIWDANTGNILKRLVGHKGRIWSLAFNFDGTMLVSGSEDTSVQLWNVATGQPLKALQGSEGRIWSVVFSIDNAMIAGSGEGQYVYIWDTYTGEVLKTLRSHTPGLWSVAFSPDGKRVLGGGEDRRVYHWDIDSEQLLSVLPGHEGRIRSVAFSSDGKRVLSGGEDQTVRIWDVTTSQLLKTLQGFSSRVWSVAFSPDGKKVLSGGEDQMMRLWDVVTGQFLKAFKGHESRIWSVAFSPDGKKAASGSDDQTVRLWDVSSGQLLKTLQEDNRWVLSVAFGPNGKILASGCGDQTVRLWDAPSGQLLKTLQGHTGEVWSVVFSPDGKILASGSEDTSVRIWDVATGQLLKTLQGHTGEVWSVAFSNDGRMLASGSDDTNVLLWDVNTEHILKTFKGHSGGVRSIVFNQDGKMIISGSDDTNVLLWDVGTGELLKTLQGHTDRVRSIDCAADGKMLVSGGTDGTVRIWDIYTQKHFKTLRSDRPYERMNITEATGLTDVQKLTLKALGAIEDELVE